MNNKELLDGLNKINGTNFKTLDDFTEAANENAAREMFNKLPKEEQEEYENFNDYYENYYWCIGEQY